MEANNIIDVSNLAIQRATDCMTLDGHNLVDESTLDVQCVDFHRGQFESGDILDKTAIFQKFMDIGLDSFLAVGIGTDSAADLQLYPVFR